MAYTLQLKRHLNYPNKEAALTGLQTYLANTAAVGEPAIATYGGSEQTYDSEKVLFGIKGAKDYTIFDYEAIPADVKAALDAIKGKGYNEDGTYATLKAIADALAIINGADTVEGSIAKAKKDAENYANTQIQALDVTDNAVVGSYVSAVSETDGKIKVTRAELPTVAEIKSEGQAIVAVKEDKGVISATAGDIAAAHVTIADAAGHFTAGTVETALEELYSQAGAGSKVTVEDAAGTEEGVLKVYTVKQGGTEVGKINIPKDLVVSSGSVVKGNWVGSVFTESKTGTGTALKLVIANQTAPVYINTLDLVKDHTSGNGINISDTNVVSVVVDPSSEFLSVGANGVKVSGVSAHVATEIGKLNANVTSTGGTFVTVNIVENGGKVEAVTVTENDIAKASDLTTEVARAKAAEKVNADAIAVLNGDAATAGSVAKAVADAKSKLIGGASAGYDTFAEVEAAIKAVSAAAISVEAGNGINVSKEGIVNTVSAKVKANDPVLEVTANGIGVKDKAVFDCGTY